MSAISVRISRGMICAGIVDKCLYFWKVVYYFLGNDVCDYKILFFSQVLGIMNERVSCENFIKGKLLGYSSIFSNRYNF